MKARVKATGEIVYLKRRVVTNCADNSTEIYYQDIYASKNTFKKEELTELIDDVVLEIPNWHEYRRELAKEIIAVLLARQSGYFDSDNKYLANRAVEIADALIECLKEKEL